jgi:hypothetical protein
VAKIAWRCPSRVYYQFLDYWQVLKPLDPRTDEAKALIDAIRSLPGYPNDYDEYRDEIVAEPYKEQL